MKPLDTAATYSGGTEGAERDAGLVARMSAGDEQALAALYDRYELMVRAQVLRIVDKPMDAEDVVEEVFWQAWRQAERFDASRGTAESWLRTIARSRALDRVRQLSRAGEVDLEEEGASAESPAASAEETVIAAEQAQMIRQALGALPAEQRAALELAYYEGLSHTEIADRTRTPLGTVKTRMRLAHQKLREALAGLGGEAA